MANTQNEFVFEESLKADDHNKPREPINCLNDGDMNVVAPKPRKKRRPKSIGTKSAAALNEGFSSPPTLFLSDREVAQRYSVSRRTIWRWVKEVEGFPHPIKIAIGTTRWSIKDLEAYERDCDKTPAYQSSNGEVAK